MLAQFEVTGEASVDAFFDWVLDSSTNPNALGYLAGPNNPGVSMVEACELVIEEDLQPPHSLLENALDGLDRMGSTIPVWYEESINKARRMAAE